MKNLIKALEILRQHCNKQQHDFVTRALEQESKCCVLKAVYLDGKADAYASMARKIRSMQLKARLHDK